MNFHIITLFPKSFDSYIGQSIIARAVKNKKIKIYLYNPRDFSKDKWKRIDQKPYSGGPGMVVQALPVVKAVEKAFAKCKNQKSRCKIIWFSPGGKQFTTDYAKKVTKKYTDIILICGRYEGLDARVKKIFRTEEISIGPYILTGGELPAMVLVDCISRQIEGVLGHFNSLEESRVASHDVYTRPEIFQYKGKKYRVPKILLSGHRSKIDQWKKTR